MTNSCVSNCSKTFDEITCLSGGVNKTGEGVVTVTIDNWTGSFPDDVMYEYKDNPTVAAISPRFSFAAYVSLSLSLLLKHAACLYSILHRGGTEYVVQGRRFDIIQKPLLLIHITSSQSERRKRETVEIIKSQVQRASYFFLLVCVFTIPWSLHWLTH